MSGRNKGCSYIAVAIIAIILWLIAIAFMIGMFEGLTNWEVVG